MPHHNNNDEHTIKEHFAAVAASRGGKITSLFWTILGLFAIFLSFRCNGGFNFGHFVAACCCGPLYVAYMLAVNYNKCFPSN